MKRHHTAPLCFANSGDMGWLRRFRCLCQSISVIHGVPIIFIPGGTLKNCRRWIPSGEHTKSNGKSPFLMGKSTINGHFPLRWIEESTGMNLLKGCWNTSWRSDRCTERMTNDRTIYIYMYTVCIQIRYVLMILLLMFYQFIACVYSNIYTQGSMRKFQYIYIYTVQYLSIYI